MQNHNPFWWIMIQHWASRERQRDRYGTLDELLASVRSIIETLRAPLLFFSEIPLQIEISHKEDLPTEKQVEILFKFKIKEHSNSKRRRKELEIQVQVPGVKWQRRGAQTERQWQSLSPAGQHSSTKCGLMYLQGRIENLPNCDT